MFQTFFCFRKYVKVYRNDCERRNFNEKINLNEYVKTSNFIKPVSTEDINGGCTLVLGCNNYGFYTKSYTYKCDKVSAHTNAAIAYANSHKYGPGKYQVTGKSSVVFLGE